MLHGSTDSVDPFPRDVTSKCKQKCARIRCGKIQDNMASNAMKAAVASCVNEDNVLHHEDFSCLKCEN